MDHCGYIYKFDDGRRPVPKYRQCEPYPAIFGDVTQERKERICRSCFEHMLRKHGDEVPVDEEGVKTGFVREWSDGRPNIIVYRPQFERHTPDDGDEHDE